VTKILGGDSHSIFPLIKDKNSLSPHIYHIGCIFLGWMFSPRRRTRATRDKNLIKLKKIYSKSSSTNKACYESKNNEKDFFFGDWVYLRLQPYRKLLSLYKKQF